MLHLAIFTSGFINLIFTGRKTIDGRFSKIRCLPYKGISRGDLILMKKSGGSIIGYFIAGKIETFDILNPDEIENLFNMYQDKLQLTDTFKESKLGSKYGTLIEICKPTKFRIPVRVKKRCLSGWIRLDGESQSQIKLF